MLVFGICTIKRANQKSRKGKMLPITTPTYYNTTENNTHGKRLEGNFKFEMYTLQIENRAKYELLWDNYFAMRHIFDCSS